MNTLISNYSDLVGDNKLKNLLFNNPKLSIPVHEYNTNVTSNERDVIDDIELLRETRGFPTNGLPPHSYFHRRRLVRRSPVAQGQTNRPASVALRSWPPAQEGPKCSSHTTGW